MKNGHGHTYDSEIPTKQRLEHERNMPKKQHKTVHQRGTTTTPIPIVVRYFYLKWKMFIDFLLGAHQLLFGL